LPPGARVPRPEDGPRLVTVRNDFSFQAGDEVKVRLGKPPIKYDDKGHIVKHTPEELKELKGADPNLPGYTGTQDNLKNGQVVVVYLARKKEALPKSEKAAETGKPESAKPDAAKLEASAPMPVGALAGTLSNLEGTTKKFTLRVETVSLAGAPAAKIDPKELVEDLQIAMIVILKD
jgi:hypothetical protein